jgi:hypothetical protein
MGSIFAAGIGGMSLILLPLAAMRLMAVGFDSRVFHVELACGGRGIALGPE